MKKYLQMIVCIGAITVPQIFTPGLNYEAQAESGNRPDLNGLLIENSRQASSTLPIVKQIQTQLIAQSNSAIFNSYVFDASYYMSLYRDLREEFGRHNLGAARTHWDRHGLAESRQGHPAFNVKYYLTKYPDLAAAFGTAGRGAYVRGIEHWIANGIRECRQGSANFNPKFYLEKYPDIARAYGSSNCKGAIDHWLKYGIKEGRQGTP
ncbi:MAG TPA: hypothetical protein VK203_17045 [Nostocaceae cyanobacterium]|nr:hypothetical protein [Nostocaceae cyanobacterium]